MSEVEKQDITQLGIEATGETFGLFLGNAAATGISAITSIIIARLLGPSNYGLYNLSLVIPSIMGLFTGLGIGAATVYFTSSYIGQKSVSALPTILKVSLLFNALLGASALIIGLILTPHLTAILLKRGELTPYVMIALPIVLLQAMLVISNNFLVGVGKAPLTGIVKIIQSLIKLIIAPSLVILGFGVLGALVGHVGGYIAAVLASLVISLSFVRGIRSSSGIILSKMKLLGDMLTYGFPLYLSGVITLIVSQYNNVIMAQMVTNEEIGGFVAAGNLTTAIAIFSTPIATILFPTFSKASATGDKHILERVLQLAMKYIILLIAPIALFTSLNSSEIITLIYGWKYVHASPYLTLYALFYTYIGVLIASGNVLSASGLSVENLKISLITLVFTIPLSPILTFFYRIPGLITAILLAGAATCIYSVHRVKVRLNMDLRLRELIPIYIATIMAILPLIILHKIFNTSIVIQLAVDIPVYLVSYLTLLGALNTLSDNDLENLQMMLGSLKLVGLIFVIALKYVKVVKSHLR